MIKIKGVKMAKRVTTPIRLTNENNGYKEPKKSKAGLVLIVALLVMVVFMIIMMLVGRAMQEQANTARKYEEQSQQNIQPQQPEEPVEPVNIQLSGTGQSSTEQFELPSGSYLVSYSFSNNLNHYGSFSDGTNFISKIICSDSYYSKSISNTIAGSGSGSEYMNVGAGTKCFYQVESASSSANWSITINNS